MKMTDEAFDVLRFSDEQKLSLYKDEGQGSPQQDARGDVPL